MTGILKLIAARLSEHCQSELKRFYFRRQILSGKFTGDEPDYNILSQFIKPGHWVLDIGANVGHYTKRFSELVGPKGRVLAFEPVPRTFSLLAANVQVFPLANVSLFNAAVSDGIRTVGIDCPKFSTGLTNYYEARLTENSESSTSVLTIALDTFDFKEKIALVKIDVEGHEESVIKGMKNLILKHKPVLIVETDNDGVIAELNAMGYSSQRLKGSPNVLFEPGNVSGHHE